jgi:hypothetical protein
VILLAVRPRKVIVVLIELSNLKRLSEESSNVEFYEEDGRRPNVA